MLTDIDGSCSDLFHLYQQVGSSYNFLGRGSDNPNWGYSEVGPIPQPGDPRIWDFQITKNSNGTVCGRDGVANPAIDIRKGPDNTVGDEGADSTVVAWDGWHTFWITVTNTGNVTLTNVTVVDAVTPACDRTSADIDALALASMASGDSVTYPCDVDKIQADIANIAVASGNPPEGDPVTDEDPSNVTVGTQPNPAINIRTQPNPAIDIRKGPDNTVGDEGADSTGVAWDGSHTFWITVTNTGNVTLTNVTVVDAVTPACDRASGDIGALASMAPGASVTYSCDAVNITTAFVNVAVATGTAPDESTPTDEDPSTVAVVAASGVIGDTVYYDCAVADVTDPTCDNGVQKAGEEGIVGAKIKITGLDGQDVDPVTAGVQTTLTQLTGANGKYLFSGLPAGKYKVETKVSDIPNPEDNVLRFTTAGSFTIDLPDGGENLTADFGVIADTLPKTGLSTDTLLVIAILLMAAGSLAVLVARREDDKQATPVAA